MRDENWLNKLFVRRIEPTKESHSSMLSDKEIIYALYTHNVTPGSMDGYLQNWYAVHSVSYPLNNFFFFLQINLHVI